MRKNGIRQRKGLLSAKPLGGKARTCPRLAAQPEEQRQTRGVGEAGRAPPAYTVSRGSVSKNPPSPPSPRHFPLYAA